MIDSHLVQRDRHLREAYHTLRECFLSQFVANFNIRRMLAI